VAETIGIMMTTYGLRVFGVLIAVFLAWTFAGWVQHWIFRGLQKENFDLTIGRIVANMARYTILVFAGLGCLGVFGIQTASFAALIAGVGLAIALAFQGSLSNLAAGVMLLVFRPFKVGNFVVSSRGEQNSGRNRAF